MKQPTTRNNSLYRILFCVFILLTFAFSAFLYSLEQTYTNNELLRAEVRDLITKQEQIVKDNNLLKSELSNLSQDMAEMKEQYENQLKLKDEALETYELELSKLRETIKTLEDKVRKQQEAKVSKSSSVESSQSTIIKVKATAYTADCKGCSGITALGIDVRESTPKIVAVDPNVVKLGSEVELIVDGKSWGIYLAGDTGGAIKGNKIDILMATKEEAKEFGRRNVELKLL